MINLYLYANPSTGIFGTPVSVMRRKKRGKPYYDAIPVSSIMQSMKAGRSREPRILDLMRGAIIPPDEYHSREIDML